MRLCDNPEIRTKFCDLHKAKMSNVAIAKELCVSLEIVKQLCRIYGVRGQGRRWPGERIFDLPQNQVRFARFYAKGLIDKEIAERMNVSESVVGNHRRSLGLDGNGGTGYGGYRVNSTTRAERKPTPGKAVG